MGGGGSRAGRALDDEARAAANARALRAALLQRCVCHLCILCKRLRGQCGALQNNQDGLVDAPVEIAVVLGGGELLRELGFDEVVGHRANA